MSDKDSQIEIKVGSKMLSVSGSEDFVEEHFFDLYEEHEFEDVQAAHSGSSSPEDHSTSDKEDIREIGKTLNEYLADSEVSTKQDNALVTGWYIEQVKGQNDFTPSEVQEEADSAKVPLGVKLKRDLDENVQKGYLHSPGERNGEERYWVTDSGEEYLEDMGVSVP